MLTFWIAFGIIGTVCVPIIIMFLVCGANLKYKIGGAIVVLGFWLLIAGGLILDISIKKNSWNGGYCECGTHWELRGASKSRHGNETKYYVCPNCYTEITQ